MSFLRGLAITAALLGASLSPAAAHRGHDALTVLTIARDGTLTLSHRFEASDIEPALGDIAPDAQPSLDDPEAVAALVAYLARHFTVSSDRGPLAFTPGAIDLGASEVRIAFSARAPRTARRLTIRSDILADIYPGQMNQLEIRFGSNSRTIGLNAGGVASVDIGPAARAAAQRPRPGSDR